MHISVGVSFRLYLRQQILVACVDQELTSSLRMYQSLTHKTFSLNHFVCADLFILIAFVDDVRRYPHQQPVLRIVIEQGIHLVVEISTGAEGTETTTTISGEEIAIITTATTIAITIGVDQAAVMLVVVCQL